MINFFRLVALAYSVFFFNFLGMDNLIITFYVLNILRVHIYFLKAPSQEPIGHPILPEFRFTEDLNALL